MIFVKQNRTEMIKPLTPWTRSYQIPPKRL